MVPLAPLLLILFLFMAPFTSLASGTDLNQVVDTLQWTYQQTADWKATFQQRTYVDLLKRDLKKSGEIFIKKPDKWRIDYREEQGRQYLSDGKKFWIYSPADAQVIVHQNLSKVLASEALVFLSGLGDLRRDFEIGWYKVGGMEDGRTLSPALHQLELRPKNRRSTVSKIVLGIDPKDFRVKESLMFNTSGNVTGYVFKQIVTNTGLAEDLFLFKRPEGVREIRG